MYLLSNNFLKPTAEASKSFYQWTKQKSNAGLLEYLLSIGGSTVDALSDNLFRFAIDTEDTDTVKNLIKLGINPNEQVYPDTNGDCCTALQKACGMRSLDLVVALIDGGAKADSSLGSDGTESLLTSATYCEDDAGQFLGHVNVGLVKILLDAGAAVNPGPGQSPLLNAAEWGHVELVDFLVSAGADVNININDSLYNGELVETPLTSVTKFNDHVSNTDVIAIVQILVKAGANPQVTSTGKFGARTVLGLAMKRKCIELIQLLLDSGARVTETSFVDGIRYGNLDIAKILLKHGGQVTAPVIESAVEFNHKLVSFLLDTVDDRGKQICRTAAFLKSIKCGRLDLIHALVVSKPQLKPTSELMNDAILEVVRQGFIDVLQFLLGRNSGYQALCLESLDKTLWTAIWTGRTEVAQLLLTAGARINSRDSDLGNNPLLAAIYRRYENLANQLLAAGVAVNGRDNSDFHSVTTSVLPAAVDWGHYSLIEKIINAGAVIDSPDSISGRSALYIAVEKKDKWCIKRLIDAGANVNSSWAIRSGLTPLSAASRYNDLQMVKYLLELGADSDEWSLTAAISGSVEVVQTLLVARLQQYKRYSKGYGCGALQRAINLKIPTMIKILLEENIDPNAIVVADFDAFQEFTASGATPGEEINFGKSSFFSAIKIDKSLDFWIVKALLLGGADPNCIVTDNRKTALLVAIEQNNLALVKVLIRAGADANPSLLCGVQRTPLQLSAEKGMIDIVRTLLEEGADINAPPFDSYGATALQFAAIGGYVGIAQLLIQQGADVNALPSKVGGRTALEGAAEHGRIDMIQLLLNAGALNTETGRAQYHRARELALNGGYRSAANLLENYSFEMGSEKTIAQVDDEGVDFSSFEGPSL